MNENAKELIKLINKTNRPKDIIFFIEKILNINKTLDEEIKIIYNSNCKKITNNFRKSLRNINEEIEKNKSSDKILLMRLNDLKKKIFEELQFFCQHLSDVLSNILIPNCLNDKEKFYYLKMKADYLRYICENEEIINNSQIDLIEEYYKQSLEIASKEFENFSIQYLGLILNYSVFLFEIAKKKDKAILLTEEAYYNIIDLYDVNISNDIYYNSTPYLQMLIDNLTIWKKSI